MICGFLFLVWLTTCCLFAFLVWAEREERMARAERGHRGPRPDDEADR